MFEVCILSSNLGFFDRQTLSSFHDAVLNQNPKYCDFYAAAAIFW